MNLDHLIGRILGFSGENVFNPWRSCDPLDTAEHFKGPHERRQRLWRHFNCIPHYLLIGEAPGYQGCHFSGVAFTNEKLLLDGVIPRVSVDGRITTRPRPWCEPSATIVWRTLYDLGIEQDVVMWNAFAWHPHKPGEPMSNRKPTNQELVAGRPVLEAVCDYFYNAKIIAVGRVAEQALQKLGIKTDGAVRHPSMGGATEFREGMARWKNGTCR